MPRCDLCFKEKPQLQPAIPHCAGKVCKGCFYEIDRVVGFLEHYGFNFIGQMDFTASKATKSKSKPRKPRKDTKSLKTV